MNWIDVYLSPSTYLLFFQTSRFFSSQHNHSQSRVFELRGIDRDEVIGMVNCTRMDALQLVTDENSFWQKDKQFWERSRLGLGRERYLCDTENWRGGYGVGRLWGLISLLHASWEFEGRLEGACQDIQWCHDYVHGGALNWNNSVLLYIYLISYPDSIYRHIAYVINY